MPRVSGIKTVKELFCADEVELFAKTSGGRKLYVPLDEDRIYIVPGYQREIRWSIENVQILIDDLKKGHKFLGTITFSTSKEKEFEIIDGQQRITVITLMLNYLNKHLPQSKKLINLCTLENESFKYFSEALKYEFDYDKIRVEENTLYNNIFDNDEQNQKDGFRNIWDAIVERISPLEPTDKEKLMQALLESDLNVIVNEIEGTDSQRKFCVDYFIDINNKAVELDSLDIIRAYAFKEDFCAATQNWVSIQEKCNSLRKLVRYTREDLYFQYFVCNVNKELEFKISKLSNEYKIKEDIVVSGKKYAAGTYVWSIFQNDKFYSNLLKDLNDYLDFIKVVMDTENGGFNKFKGFFKTDTGNADETRILNAHTIINAILRNDDLVPKMMIMKYYFEVLRPETVRAKQYRVIRWIGIIANIFTMGKKTKGSELIASRLFQKDWQKALTDYAIKIYKDIPMDIDFGKVVRDKGAYTVESGQYMARRYFSMVDSYVDEKFNEDTFKNENITTGDKNVEHFMINRDYSYALYLDDGNTVDIEITLPAKSKKNIATVANYLILDSQINSNLRNKPAYEKIEQLEKEFLKSGIENVIPSDTCRKHYFLLKKIMHDESSYPKKTLDSTIKKTDCKKELKSYYQNDFPKEYSQVVEGLSDSKKMFEAEIEYYIKKLGFNKNDGIYEYHCEGTNFLKIEIEINHKKKLLYMTAELGNPFYGDTKDKEAYEKIIEKVESEIECRCGVEPEIHSSFKDSTCEDESVSFVLKISPIENEIKKNLDLLINISNEL